MQARSTISLPKKGKAYRLLMQGNSRCAHGIHFFPHWRRGSVQNNVNSDDGWQGVPFELTVQTHFSCVRTDAGTTSRDMEHDVIL